jgi:hypothetical protein
MGLLASLFDSSAVDHYYILEIDCEASMVYKLDLMISRFFDQSRFNVAFNN